ncbi:hypothetical protein CFOL_v3_27220 [Cephalotus follicularis]|uniref:DHHA1 domain-containing protein n=1 Tax=Cephalotus follicularis TaxID=3775 RepID=A0A1Q3CUD8_CEPFO|nr:hypothetical protein CFOL_v3_27220 [Cephalotus follicularis]
MKVVKKSAVLYHYPCPDGAFAALAAHLYFSAAATQAVFIPNTVYDPINTQHLPPHHQISNLYLLDFVGPPGFVQDISTKVGGRVIILDHHKTALEMLDDDGDAETENVTKVLDMARSGATIAFDYFKEKLLLLKDYGRESDVVDKLVTDFERVRPLFQYIEDGDLWRWSLPNSKAFSSGFKDLNFEFDVRLNPSLFDQLLSLDVESVIAQGMTTLSLKQKLIQDTLDQSYEIALGGGLFGHCLAVNADTVSELRSELGHQLATKSLNSNLRGVTGGFW